MFLGRPTLLPDADVLQKVAYCTAKDALSRRDMRPFRVRNATYRNTLAANTLRKRHKSVPKVARINGQKSKNTFYFLFA